MARQSSLFNMYSLYKYKLFPPFIDESFGNKKKITISLFELFNLLVYLSPKSHIWQYGTNAFLS